MIIQPKGQETVIQKFPHWAASLLRRHAIAVLAITTTMATAFAPGAQAQSTPSGLNTLFVHEFIASLGLHEGRPHTNELLLAGQAQHLKMFRDSRRLQINGIQVFMNGPLTLRSNTWALCEADVNTVLRPLVQPYRSSSTNRLVVVLDPGHGGGDAGAGDKSGLAEKMLTLDIAQRIRRRFRNSGVHVKLTRNTDTFIPLRERTRKAAAWNADVFVSIHMNSAANTHANGIETYVLPAAGFPSTSGGSNGKKRYPGNTHDAANSGLAYGIHRGLQHATKSNDRGIKRSRFDVLCWAPCPAVLVECGFLSNKKDAKELLSIKHREAVADGITRGILTYLSAPHVSVVRHTP